MTINKSYGVRNVERHFSMSTRAWGSPHCLPSPGSQALTLPGNQETDILAQIQALTTDPSADTADCVLKKSSHHSSPMGWHIAKDAGLPLTYTYEVNILTVCLMCSKQQSRYLPQVSGAIQKSSPKCWIGKWLHRPPPSEWGVLNIAWSGRRLSLP